MAVFTLLVLGHVALWVQGVAVGLLGLLVVVLWHGAQWDQLDGMRLLRGVLVCVTVVGRGLQVHGLRLLLWQVLHQGLGLVILRYLHGALSLLQLELLLLLRLHVLHGHARLAGRLWLRVILVLLHLRQVLGQHGWRLQGLCPLHGHLRQGLLVVIEQVPLARVLAHLESGFGQPPRKPWVRLLGHWLVAGGERRRGGLQGFLGQQLAEGAVRGPVHHC